jgi:hypothetical protein
MAWIRRKRRRGQPAPIGGVLAAVYPSREPEELMAIRVFGWWDKAVPPRVARNARPVRMHGGVLTVHTTTASWASDLDFLRPQLLASVQKHAPAAKVKEIRIKVGRLPDMPVRPPEPEKIEVVPLDVLPDEIARALAAVPDDAVRDAVAAAAAVALAPRPAPKAGRKNRP